MHEFEKFWMVYGSGKEPPGKMHETIESARAEAERLAQIYPGTAFFVLSAVQACRVSSVDWYKLEI